jgi:hypothetical protein
MDDDNSLSVYMNQCNYSKSPGSFHGIAFGKYSISWYKGEKCKGKAVASTKNGKFVNVRKWSGPLSFKVSHQDDHGVFPREVSCAQKGVGGQKYEPLKNQTDYSTTVCVKVETLVRDRKMRIEKPMYNGGKPGKSTGRGYDCEIISPEIQKLYDAECKKRKGYTCQRYARIGGKNQLVACDKPVDVWKLLP